MNVYFIRHGFSYANATHMNLVSNDFSKYVDSPLTTIGLQFSQKAGKQLKKLKLPIEVVYCSPLMRAVQTACKMFPESKIKIISHVKELENEEADKLANANAKESLIKRLFPKVNINTDALRSPQKNSTDYKKFVVFLKNRANEGYKNIVVVTHSMYMKKHLNMHIPHNNEVVLVKYNFDTNTQTSPVSIIQEGMKIGVNVPLSKFKSL
jgi:broad specificity phosphatase PhoE